MIFDLVGECVKLKISHPPNHNASLRISRYYIPRRQTRPANRAARIIVMIEEDSELDNEYCDNPTPEQIADNIRQAFREKQAGQRIPFSQLWDGIDTHVE